MTIEVVYVKLKKNKIIMSLRGCVKKIINKKKRSRNSTALGNQEINLII